MCPALVQITDGIFPRNRFESPVRRVGTMRSASVVYDRFLDHLARIFSSDGVVEKSGVDLVVEVFAGEFFDGQASRSRHGVLE
jgi:hypothetical protein